MARRRVQGERERYHQDWGEKLNSYLDTSPSAKKANTVCMEGGMGGTMSHVMSYV